MWLEYTDGHLKCNVMWIWQGLADINKPPELISGNMTGGWTCLFFGKSFLFVSFFCYGLDFVVTFNVDACSDVYLLGTFHEICMDGTASQLSTSSMPCLKWDRSTLSTLTMGKGPRVSFTELWLKLDYLCFSDIILSH